MPSNLGTLPDAVTRHILGFVSPEDRRKEFGGTSRRNRTVAKEKIQHQIWGSCDGCRDKDKMSLYFKRTVDKNCPYGSKMVECGKSGTECCKVPLQEGGTGKQLHNLLKDHGHENKEMFDDIMKLDPPRLIHNRPQV